MSEERLNRCYSVIQFSVIEFARVEEYLRSLTYSSHLHPLPKNWISNTDAKPLRLTPKDFPRE